MSTADNLRELRIFNPWNAAEFAYTRGGVGVYVAHRAGQNGRAFVAAAWQVISVTHKTDPDAHWTDRGWKTFGLFQNDRVRIEQEALLWATETYGVQNWVKITGLPRCWFPEGDAEIVKDALREVRS